MHRLQIQLTEGQEHALRDLALLRESSISALIREGVDLLLVTSTQTEQRKKALGIIGAYASYKTDVSTRHDAYLAQAYIGEDA